MLGLCSIDIHKKRPKTSMVTANRMLNRALGIRGDGDRKTCSPSNDNSLPVKNGPYKYAEIPSSSSNKTISAQNVSTSAAANRMFNRALGIKCDSKLKSSVSRDLEPIATDNSNTSNQIQQMHDNAGNEGTGQTRKPRINCDPSVAANRMFKRALGSQSNNKR